MATSTMKSLREKAVLVKFSDSVWTAAKKDEKATKHVLDAHAAKSGAGSFKSRLVSKAALEHRWDVSHHARAYHIQHTSPWMDEGVRMVPVRMLKDYSKAMRAYQAEAEAADREFLSKLDEHIREAKILRGKLFDPADYPSKEILATKFAFQLDIMPIPDAGDWRLEGMGVKEMEALRAQAEGVLTNLQQAAVRELFERLAEVVTHLKERLQKDDAKFRNSLVGNVKECVELVAQLNVTGDPKLEAVRKEIETKLSKQDPEELRDAPVVRGKVAKEADAILKKMASYMGVKK